MARQLLAVQPKKSGYMAHWLFLPNDAINDIETLSGLSRENLAALQKFLDSTDFQRRNTFYVKAADLLGISDEKAASLCSFVNYIQRQRTQQKKSGESVPDELEHFLASQPEDKRSKLLGYVRENKKVLSDLFAELPVYELSSKIRGLETGPLPHLASFRTFCDLRPVYNPDGSKIVSSFPLITCQLVVHSTETNRHTEIVVQLKESDIEEFTSQFDRLKKKLVELHNRFSTFLAKKDEE
jgi:hypothetical protein